MRIIETTLATMCDPASDPADRWQRLADLEELLTRHAHFGNHPPYSFHDRAIATLPDRLGSESLRQIAAGATRIMLDPAEPDPIRVSATFLLGKTQQRSGLTAVVNLISTPGDLPDALARQCGFTFDTLAFTSDFSLIRIDLDQVGAQFERRGIPWDRVNRCVDVNRL